MAVKPHKTDQAPLPSEAPNRFPPALQRSGGGVPHPAINTDGPWPLKAYGTRHTHHVTSRGSLSLMSSVYEEEMVTACEGHTNVWEITNLYTYK